MRKLLPTLLTMLALTGHLSSIADAQTSSPGIGSYLARALQGQERSLPEDFVARVDRNELKMSLRSLGVEQSSGNQDLAVMLIQDDGSMQEARPDADGNVSFNKFSDGLSALVVTGQQAAYAAMAFYIDQSKATSEPKADVPAPRSTAFDVPLANVDRTQIRSGVEASGTAPKGAAVRPLADFTSRPANRFQVKLQPDGTLIGRVIVPEDGFISSPGQVNLSFYRNAVIAANTVTSVEGNFFVRGLTPGIHSVFASGPAGHAAYSFEILAPENEELPKISGRVAGKKETFVSVKALNQAGDELIVLLIPPRLMPAVRQAVQRDYPPAAPVVVDGIPMDMGMPAGPGFGPPGLGGGGFAGGGAGGLGAGGSGGGGGLGGLGGIGGLLGIGGLAAGVAAFAANNDDDFVVPPATLIAP